MRSVQALCADQPALHGEEVSAFGAVPVPAAAGVADALDRMVPEATIAPLLHLARAVCAMAVELAAYCLARRSDAGRVYPRP